MTEGICSHIDVLEALHNISDKSEVKSVLVNYADVIGAYAEDGDKDFFVSLGQLLEQL